MFGANFTNCHGTIVTFLHDWELSGRQNDFVAYDVED